MKSIKPIVCLRKEIWLMVAQICEQNPPMITNGGNAMQVVVSSESGLTQEITSGAYRLQADEPVEFGGAAMGPSPYELLLASLGACTSMTLRLYANRKGWNLERITVRLRHSRVHVKDCAECETKHPFMDRIEREIILSGNLTDEQKARLKVIAESCPVHRTLTSVTEIRTELA
jgi:putative redox protein